MNECQIISLLAGVVTAINLGVAPLLLFYIATRKPHSAETATKDQPAIGRWEAEAFGRVNRRAPKVEANSVREKVRL